MVRAVNCSVRVAGVVGENGLPARGCRKTTLVDEYLGTLAVTSATAPKTPNSTTDSSSSQCRRIVRPRNAGRMEESSTGPPQLRRPAFAVDAPNMQHVPNSPQASTM